MNLNPVTGPLLKPTPKKHAPKPLKGRPHVIPQNVREAVLEQYGYTCQWCLGEGGALDCHHVIRRSQGGKDEVGNLLPVHRKCHRTIHDNPSVAKARGFLA